MVVYSRSPSPSIGPDAGPTLGEPAAVASEADAVDTPPTTARSVVVTRIAPTARRARVARCIRLAATILPLPQNGCQPLTVGGEHRRPSPTRSRRASHLVLSVT